MPNREPVAADVAARIGQVVRADKLKLLYQLSFPTLFVTLTISFMLAWISRHEVPAPVLYGWLVLMCLSLLVRLLLYVAYFRYRPQGTAMLRWEWPYVGTLSLSSLFLGLGTMVLMLYLPLLEQVVCMFVMIGMAGGAISNFSAIRLAAVVAMMSVLLPGTLLMLWQGGEVRLCVVLGAVIFMIASLRAIRMQASALRDSLQLAHELELAHGNAAALARTDALTGLNNRRAFFERGEQLARYCERHGTPFSLLLMDVDHFKAINDSCGHAAGDAALGAVGELLRQQFRRADVCGRIGGEEFAVLLPDTAQTDALALAEKLRQAIAAVAVPFGERELSLTASIGVAAGNYDLDALLSQADAAMYRAKAAGRNRVVG